ncbi:MAG: SusC/RagA family TonB-linked outer membrane protein [Porphyromonas sp.]|nr:SusC/RagA family TonB-linked outer membrane protein [Porphyromonas sp.]
MQEKDTVLWRAMSHGLWRSLMALMFLVLGLNYTTAQSLSGRRSISGVIVDEQELALPNASIVIKGTKRGVTADLEGRFTIEVEPGQRTLVISYVGMQSEELTLTAGQSHYRVQLLPDNAALNEVIVTGYQTISKERATGSFAVLTPKSLKGKLQTDIGARLEGQVAGLVQQGGSLTIRGISTLNGNTQPLIVVDGMPYEGALSSISPALIENITVLKDATAASIYGARSANGVIVITTKRGNNEGKTVVQYDGSVRFRPRPDMAYLGLVGSADMVRLQQLGFPQTTPNEDPRYSVNPVYALLREHSDGKLSDTQLSTELAKHAGRDNRSQLRDFYTRLGVLQQHTLSLSRGNDKQRYIASIDYLGNRPISRHASDERLGFSLRNSTTFFRWLRADLSIAGNFTTDRSDLGVSSYEEFYRTQPSYYMLRDAAGQPLPIPQTKSESELLRLRSLGLQDEGYSPILNEGKETALSKSQHYRIQLGLDFILSHRLNLNLKYQAEFGSAHQRQLYAADSYKVRAMINDAAVYAEDTDELTLNVPEGAQLSEQRSDNTAHTLRAQFNYMNEWGKHYVTALGGSEVRQVKSSGTQSYLMGYDDNSLGHTPYNPMALFNLRGTQSLSGAFMWDHNEHNSLFYTEDRFVSFYANASYTYDHRYNLTGSIRMDQSNLFGTDPKYQYRPLWSVGASWFLKREAFMSKLEWVDLLNLRFTYGIRGNVPKEAGPFLTLYAPTYTNYIGAMGSQIKNPPNSSLRWEKTATTNVGLDFQLLGHRLFGSVDYYDKYTTDLLAQRNADPTLGHKQLMLNYGRMSNRGIELTLGGHIDLGPVKWSPSLTYSYNKNKLLNVEESSVEVLSRSRGNASVEGYPMSALFSFRYAGLRERDGLPLFYSSVAKAQPSDEDAKVRTITSVDDLVYSGTTVPPHAASWTNRFAWRDLELSFMFVYYGGHVMRGVAAPWGAGDFGSNPVHEGLNPWLQPGDETKPGVTPGFVNATLDPVRHLHPYAASDINTYRGDYIKLRDLSLSYTLPRTFVRRLGMSAASLSLQLQNLWTWTANDRGYDPEAMTTYAYGWGMRTLPTPTTYTLGLSVTF